MKRTAMLLLLVMMPLIGMAGGQQRTRNTELESLVNQISRTPGVEVVKLGSLGTGLLRKAIKAGMNDVTDPQEKEMLNALMGIKKIAVIDYSSCNESLSSKFNRKIEKVLDADNLLVDVKDDGDSMKIYGFVTEDGSTVKDFVLHSSSDNSLICLFGTISLDKLMEIR